MGLWLPIPADTDYQKLTDIRFEGSYRKAGIYTEKLYGSRMLYAHFPKGIGDKRIEVRLSVSFSPRSVSLVEGEYRPTGEVKREVFGIRVLPSKLSSFLSIKRGSYDITKAQHCRAEFWAGRWIPVDPADVTKIRLKEKLPPDHTG